MFLEQSSRWLPIAKSHLDKVIAVVSKWLRRAVARILPEDKLGQDVLAICTQWIDEASACAFMELAKLQEDERRQPITYNHYYTHNVQKSRHDFLREAVESAIKETASSDYLGKLHVSNSPSELDRFLGAMKRKINVDMDEQACTEALAGLDAYY